jgi:DNA modification methylase
MRKVFDTPLGSSFHADSLKLITSKRFLDKNEGKIDLIITSPPFSLIKKKKYGNKVGEEYIEWLQQFSRPLSRLLSKRGSIIIELGNSWEKGVPVFSTVPIEALLRFKTAGGFFLCQEFICHNPSRIPSPVEWVNVRRERVKDSYTRLWWMSKNPHPKADNTKILKHYSASLRAKMKSNKLTDEGQKPSGHNVTQSFLKDNGGSISPNFLSLGDNEYLFEESENSLSIANASNQNQYNSFCLSNDLQRHPARMQRELVEYFIRFLTDENDLVFDPFAGSNTTGLVAEELKRKWIASELNLDYIKGSLIRFFNEDKALLRIKKLAKRGL